MADKMTRREFIHDTAVAALTGGLIGLLGAVLFFVW